MINDITQQGVLFNELLDRPVHVRFDQPDSSSDGGALLLKAVDRRLDLTQRLANCLFDKRDPNFIVHSYRDLYDNECLAFAVVMRIVMTPLDLALIRCNDVYWIETRAMATIWLPSPHFLASKMPSVSARLIRWPTHWPMSWSNVIESDWARRSKR